MAVDLTLPLRQAVVTHLRGLQPVSDIVSDRVYGEKPPTDPEFPFTRYGYDTMAPFSAQCVDGGQVDVTIHTFAKGASTDALKPLNAAVVNGLDGAQLELDEGWCLDITFVRAQTLPDGPDGFHGVLFFTALTGIEAA